MDLIKKRMEQYLLSLIEKDELTPEEYAILAMEYQIRKDESERKSNDTIMRIFRAID